MRRINLSLRHLPFPWRNSAAYFQPSSWTPTFGAFSGLCTLEDPCQLVKKVWISRMVRSWTSCIKAPVFAFRTNIISSSSPVLQVSNPIVHTLQERFSIHLITMKSIQTIAAALAFGVLSVTAAPAASSVEMREDVGILAQASIFMCKDTRWNGQCQNVLVNLDSCSK